PRIGLCLGIAQLGEFALELSDALACFLLHLEGGVGEVFEVSTKFVVCGAKARKFAPEGSVLRRQPVLLAHATKMIFPPVDLELIAEHHSARHIASAKHRAHPFHLSLLSHEAWCPSHPPRLTRCLPAQRYNQRVRHATGSFAPEAPVPPQ